MRKRRFISWSYLSAELKRRQVYPVVIAYAVVAWFVLQFGEVTFEPLSAPPWAMPALIVTVVLGFPVAVALAWMYDIKPLRIEREAADPAGDDADPRPSIAVLPFLDLSPEGDQGYFCEGVAEEILNALTRIRQLRVAARSSSFQFDPKAGDVREIGRKLGVKSILEGSVRKDGDHVRITAQLVKVRDGYHLWSKTFDERIENIFVIQDEIAASIASALVETISAKEKQAIRTPARADIDAFDFYLRGRQFFKQFRRAHIQHAMQMYRQAIDIDPHFALAWAGYADCHALLMMYAEPKPEYADEAIMASRRALELAPELAQAHASYGLACLVCQDFENSDAAFEKAIELNPDLFEAWYYFARSRFHQGDMDGAAELFRKAANVDPTDYQSRCLRVQILRGTGHEAQAREEAGEAVAVVRRHLEWSPDDPRALHLGAGPLIALGNEHEAKQWLRRAMELDPNDSIALYNVACNFATMGEVDEALAYLERAVDAGTVSADWMRNDEDLANLRSSAGYKRLLGKLENGEGQPADVA
ncbi:MAG: tetratricopeptide repeat protein [Woeseiaceae bacterium]|nr:tetratricopeptide repeat protein [Woeseiaceae bacterium]